MRQKIKLDIPLNLLILIKFVSNIRKSNFFVFYSFKKMLFSRIVHGYYI